MEKYVIFLRRKDDSLMFRYIKIETVCRNFEEASIEARRKINGLLFGQHVEYEIDTIAREWLLK